MNNGQVSTPVMVGIVVLVLAVVGGLWWHFGNQTEAAQAAASQTSKPPAWFDATTGKPRAAGTNSSGASSAPSLPGTSGAKK